MDILHTITAQIASLKLPLYAVTLTAVPQPGTPLLLMLHWHGFRLEDPPGAPDRGRSYRPIPGSALQVNAAWQAIEELDAAMLDAAWQLGAWDMERTERRGCNTIGASEREALECRQAFGEHPLSPAEAHLLAEAPDREDLMHFAAARGYLRWLFRPVRGGLWQETAEDDTLAADGSRQPPCPVAVQAPRGGKAARTVYRLGSVQRLILPTGLRAPS